MHRVSVLYFRRIAGVDLPPLPEADKTCPPKLHSRRSSFTSIPDHRAVYPCALDEVFCWYVY